MPGPNSAPNGDKKLVTDAKLRESLRIKGVLRTGKTERKK